MNILENPFREHFPLLGPIYQDLTSSRISYYFGETGELIIFINETVSEQQMQMEILIRFVRNEMEIR